MPEYPTLPPLATEPISVILLACGKDAPLHDVLAGWTAFLDRLSRDYEIIVVDDAGSDLAATHPRVRLLKHETPQGEGAALRTGLAAATHPLLAYAPADGRYQPEDLRRLLDEIDKAHLVSGFRTHLSAPAWLRGIRGVYRSLVRVIFALPLETPAHWYGWRAFGRGLLFRLLFSVRLQDAGCTFRLFRRSVFSRIPIQSNGPFAHIEILAKANFLGHIMTEAPVRFPTGEDQGAASSTWKECYRVLSRPDFGR